MKSNCHFPLSLSLPLSLILSLTLSIQSCSHSQTPAERQSQLVGAPCEGCEAVFEFGDQRLNSVDTLPDFEQEGKRIKITGTIYENDGKTPANDVILYVYHTNQEGIYPTKGDEEGWASRHGYIRGWLKTGKDGKYTFYTLKPGAYPGGNNPAHIHATILEPNGKYYYIDDYHYKGDSLLSQRQRNPQSPRGGHSGLLDLVKNGNLWDGQRDIILGKNVPSYQ